MLFGPMPPPLLFRGATAAVTAPRMSASHVRPPSWAPKFAWDRQLSPLGASPAQERASLPSYARVAAPFLRSGAPNAVSVV